MWNRNVVNVNVNVDVDPDDLLIVPMWNRNTGKYRNETFKSYGGF